MLRLLPTRQHRRGNGHNHSGRRCRRHDSAGATAATAAGAGACRLIEARSRPAAESLILIDAKGSWRESCIQWQMLHENAACAWQDSQLRYVPVCSRRSSPAAAAAAARRRPQPPASRPAPAPSRKVSLCLSVEGRCASGRMWCCFHVVELRLSPDC